MKRVLIVEDLVVFQRTLGEAINSLSQAWMMNIFASGKEALAFLREQSEPPDLALIDLGLPDISGVEVIRELHRDHPQVPILVLSMFSTDEKVMDAIHAGAMGYVLKDDETFAITDAIGQVMTGHFPISPMVARYLVKVASEVGPKHATPLPNSPRLSRQERVLLEHIAAGRTYSEAANLMELTLSTVQSYSRNLFRKLDAHSQTQAIAKAKGYQLL